MPEMRLIRHAGLEWRVFRNSRAPRNGCPVMRRAQLPAIGTGLHGDAAGDSPAGRERAGGFPGRPDPLELPAYLAILATGLHENTMVKIRLTRGGAKKRPFYHIVVTDSRSARDGRNIERVGYYNPVAAGNEQRIVLDIARVDHWVGHGAQLTEKVRSLYKEATKAQAAAA